MLNEEIADMLREYHRAKKQAKELHAEMVRFVIEDLGMDQQEASRMDIAAFLDGYLVGRGMMQSWRNIGEQNANRR